ncbi:MAG: two-component system response regulator, partial [Methanomicrobiales archaeon HGW-Methanomicrobiales-4]
MTGILIIDDNAEDQKRASAILSSFGYRISGVASDGETGIFMYREKRPDLVIIDLILTGINGIEVLRSIRNEYPECRA